MNKRTEELLNKYRAEANFINEQYGLGDEDHDTALDRGNIYDLMRKFALYNVGRSELLNFHYGIQRI